MSFFMFLEIISFTLFYVLSLITFVIVIATAECRIRACVLQNDIDPASASVRNWKSLALSLEYKKIKIRFTSSSVHSSACAEFYTLSIFQSKFVAQVTRFSNARTRSPRTFETIPFSYYYVDVSRLKIWKCRGTMRYNCLTRISHTCRLFRDAIKSRSTKGDGRRGWESRDKKKYRVCAHVCRRRNRIFTYRGESGRKDTPGTAVIAAPGGPGGSGSRTCLRPWPPPRRPPAHRPLPRQHPAPAVDLTAVAAVAAVVAGDAGGGYCSADGRGPRQSATAYTYPLISWSLAW